MYIEKSISIVNRLDGKSLTLDYNNKRYNMKNNMKLMKKKKERENKGTIKPAQNFKWEGLKIKKKENQVHLPIVKKRSVLNKNKRGEGGSLESQSKLSIIFVVPLLYDRFLLLFKHGTLSYTKKPLD